MLDIEDQLRRYGEAVERHLEDGRDGDVRAAPPNRRRSRSWVVAAAVVLVALVSAALVVTSLDDDPAAVVSTAPASGGARGGVFSTPTDAVLLFSDGIDGATAIDLDRRIASRRVIEGERAGDQSFRLTLTGGHLVVGWGEIYAAPLTGAPRARSPMPPSTSLRPSPARSGLLRGREAASAPVRQRCNASVSMER